LKAAAEGFIPFLGYRTWYRIVGETSSPGRLPLLVLHGGPGSPHDYLEPLEALADSGRQVVFYDQLGCGNSDAPVDLSIYTMELFVKEVEAVRQALGLERVHLYGHSWGGMLAMEYALTRPSGLESLVLSNTGASSAHWIRESAALLEGLPAETRQIIHRNEQNGTTGSAEYRRACRLYYQRHGSGRIHPRPDCLTRMKGKPGEVVYQHMWGPSEWFVTGTLLNWDISARLGEIQAPTLVLGGRYDHATPALAAEIHAGIPGSELLIFEHSGHFAHLEETTRYLQALEAFMGKVEAPG
jgi:proline-specific peptidase